MVSFTATWTLDPAVKPFGTTVKKEMGIEVETSEKIWGYVAGEGEFENGGREPLGSPKRAPKKFLKKYFLEEYMKCIIRRFNNHQGSQSPEEGSKKKGRHVGKHMGIRSGRRGIRK